MSADEDTKLAAPEGSDLEPSSKPGSAAMGERDEQPASERDSDADVASDKGTSRGSSDSDPELAADGDSSPNSKDDAKPRAEHEHAQEGTADQEGTAQEGTKPNQTKPAAATRTSLVGRWWARLSSSEVTLPLDQELVHGEAQTNPWGKAARSLVLGLVVGIALVAWARFSYQSYWVVEFLQKNRLELSRRMDLISSMLMGGAVGVVAVAGALGFAHKKRLDFAIVERWMWFLSPLALAPTLPLLLRYRAWEDRHEDMLPALLFVGLVLELFLFQCLRNVPPRARKAWESTVEEVPLLLRRHGPVLIVVGAAIGYSVFMSFYTTQWHHKMGTGNYDLGINNNLMYGGLFGDFNQSRIVFPQEPAQYIANHVKIGAYVFLPIYALAPRPETLQVIQSTMLGFGAVPLFLFSRRYVSQWMAAVVALGWLAYYPVHGANFYEVKMVPIASFFVLTTVWAADAKRWVIMGVACVIGVLLREDMPIGFAVIGGFLLLSGHRPVAGLIMALVASGWFVLLRFHIMEEAGQWWFPKMYRDLWAEGETGFRSVVKTLVSNPFFTLTHVLIEKKIIYLMHLLVPLLFLPARRWYLWAAFLPGAMLTLLVTDYKPVTMFSFQYVMHWAPYMFLALPLALVAYEREGANGTARARAALAAVAFCIAILSYNYGAFPARDGALKSGYHRITFSMDDTERERYAQLLDIISSIPPNASVAASEKIGPHVSSRRVFYSLRRDSYHADYLVVRKKGLRLDRTKRVITDALTSGEYGVYRRVGEFVLIKRGHPTTDNGAVIDEWRLQGGKRDRPPMPGRGPEDEGEPSDEQGME